MSNNTYTIPPIASGPSLSRDKLTLTLCPEALRLKKDYREALEKYSNDPTVLKAFEKYGVKGKYELQQMSQEHAEECIGLAAYQFAGMGGVEQMLLSADLREMLFYMHTIVHLAIAFGMSTCVLDAQTHTVVGLVICFDVMHMDTFYEIFDVATDEMKYDCELEAKYITFHPLIQQLLTYNKRSSDGSAKALTPSVNRDKVKWRIANYGMYYCLKPQNTGEHLQMILRLPMYVLPYLLGYQYYFHFEANMKIRPDPIKIPEFTYDYSLFLQDLVFSDGKTFMDLLKANRSRFHPVVFQFCQNVMLPNARTFIAVIFYDRTPRHLSTAEVVLRYLEPAHFVLKTKPPAKL
ncbi:hypothetical protein RFI_08744 [Reticulomyxa filosa]|uniref:Uncharacterized protein n=1 Tax=Reticulomyxa filosa TaxID=46433 RepID=X6NRR8_RETFI|nr:hypothetical protein RFI_08744 [Reticulomyxa filosa]|eukprot:ETO28389.1 hypothetical protein RFI_08744 [Reticulomyxa filosa]